jgi:hypothetical protein
MEKGERKAAKGERREKCMPFPSTFQSILLNSVI